MAYAPLGARGLSKSPDVESYYRQQYFEAIDTVSGASEDRFHKKNFLVARQIEQVLTSGKGLDDTDIPSTYAADVNINNLKHARFGTSAGNGGVTEAFEISNGVKQGCVLAPVLFNVFFTCMLSHAVRGLEKGVFIRYRLDGSLFDLRRLTAKTKCSKDLLQEALFADDCALVAHDQSDLQVMLDRFSEASKLFGLTISLGKTEVLHQPAPHTNPPAPSISIDGTQLSNVESFKYLGSTISCDGSLDKEIDARISKASQALGRLRNRVLNQHNIRQSTKLKVYNAVVLPSLLYGCESWTSYRRHIKQLEKFHMRALRSILGIRWQDRITNLEVLDRAQSCSIESMLLKAQLRWVGHVIRMEEHRMPRRLLYGELAVGRRHQGRPKKRYKDCVKANLHCGGQFAILVCVVC
nr:hypothetical protein BaRGS_022386 [Batillaria attramentaria]